MARRRSFGEVERRVSVSGAVTYRARYAMPDGTRYSRTLATRMDAEAWLVSERGVVARDVWSPPQVRRAAEEKRQRDAAHNTGAGFAERYLAERSLRPTTIRGYRKLLASRILPYFGDTPLIDVSLTEIKRWRASLGPTPVASNAAAYRLLRSLLQAAAEEELIDRAPPKVRGARSTEIADRARGVRRAARGRAAGRHRVTYLKVQGTDWPDAGVPEPGNVGAYEVLDESLGIGDVGVDISGALSDSTSPRS